MGAGQAEVQDLADDVGRQEREGGAGELAREPFAQGLDVGVGAGHCVVIERDQDVGVDDADRAGNFRRRR